MKLKRILLSLFGAFCACTSVVLAQPSQPLQWSVSTEALGNDEYIIRAEGTFDSEGWHIYDMSAYEDGPLSTTLSVSGATVIESPAIVSEIEKAYDEIFGMEIGTCSGPVVIQTKVKAAAGTVAELTIECQCCREGMCIPPEEFTSQVSLGEAGEKSGSSNIWRLILQAMAWGFVALLTPCVFPMIPMTVSFFIKQNGQKKRRGGKWLAMFFGLSIIALYTVPVAILIAVSLLTGGQAVTADIFNFLATHWIPNLLFFIVFMLFAASFFGAFEITLPASLTTKSDSKADKGGMIGAFFVALTLVLVSFSCTGPIVGSVLIKSAQGQIWEPVVTMFAFALAFSLPFTLFAFAPSLLKKLPKSGGWLNSVKVVLGFVEVALGFKFLSVADQTYHWGILPRETYLAIWIVVFTMLGFYLLGKLRFKNDSPLEYVTIPRLGLSIASFAFVVYMIPGMWGAPLKALSGYLPPITTQDFVLGSGSEAQLGVQDEGTVKYSDFLELPYGIHAFFDYEQGRQAALAQGKPMLVDFTGHGCVNCREMEARVWSDPRVLKMMKEDYVVVALYADDKKLLPEKDWVTTAEGKVLKSLGKVNSYFALTRFGVNAQPYYAILDPATEEHKVQPRGYDLEVEAFVKFLNSGK